MHSLSFIISPFFLHFWMHTILYPKLQKECIFSSLYAKKAWIVYLRVRVYTEPAMISVPKMIAIYKPTHVCSMEHYYINVLNLCMKIIELVRKGNLLTDDNLPLTLSLLNSAPLQNKKFSKTCLRMGEPKASFFASTILTW